jgi:Arc/MetJ-type ribon-helix-helix transcriptional regulator
MKRPTTITASLDEETKEIFERLIEESGLSRSKMVREALRFYARNRETFEKAGGEKIRVYTELLSSGEHVILDLDHWALFLKELENLESSSNADEFWKVHTDIAISHAEQLGQKIDSVEGLLRRLEICNFFKLGKTSEREFTIILGSKTGKEFIKTFLENALKKMGFKVKITGGYSKLRVTLM